MFSILYPLLHGAALGLGNLLSLQNSWNFYPDKKGQISGLILSSYSIGAVIWILVTTALANPENIQPTLKVKNGESTEILFDLNSEVVANVPHMFTVIGIILFVLTLLATILVSKKKKVEVPMSENDIRESLLFSYEIQRDQTASNITLIRDTTAGNSTNIRLDNTVYNHP